MQTAIRYQSKAQRNRREEIWQNYEEQTLSQLAAKLQRHVAKKSYFAVQSLKITAEPQRVTLSGICESYYIKQLAQQAVLDMISEGEIVNNIAVI